MTDHNNGNKAEKYMIISLDAEKEFDKILFMIKAHPFMIKAQNKLEVEGKLLNPTKDIDRKVIANIIMVKD